MTGGSGGPVVRWPERATCALLLVLVLGLGISLPAQAQNQCARGASPTNPVAVASSGVGGTGAPAQERLGALTGAWRSALGWLGLERADSSGGIGGTGVVVGRPGLGGTGIDNGGIGGTGIVGVITGFASICVNGVEVHFGTDTPVTDNGQPASARQLAVGQVVAVRAAGAGAEVSARTIALIHAAVGPIGALNFTSGEFQILGQQARTPDPAELADMKPGDWVRVSGQRLANGEIAVSRLEPMAPQAQAQVNGFVRQADADSFTVGGTPVHFDKQTPPPGLAPGQEVTASGVWDGRALQVQQAQVEPTRMGLGAVDAVVLEGFVHAVGERQLSLGFGPLTLGPQATIVGGSLEQLVINQRVQVTGRVGADQRITVDRLEFGGARAGPEGSRGSGVQRGAGSSGGKGSSDRSRLTERIESEKGSGSSGSSGSSAGSGSSSGSGSSGSSGGSEKSGESERSRGSEGSGGTGSSGGSGSLSGSGSSGGSGSSEGSGRGR